MPIFLPNNTCRIVLALVCALALSFAGCGGGENAPSKFSISGIAAQGAPMKGAIISLLDATGTEVAAGTAGDDGSYILTVPATAKAPLVVSATGNDVTQYAPIAQLTSSTINITTLTTVIAAQLSPTGDPSALGAQIKAGLVNFNASAVKAVSDGLVNALKPLLQNAGDTSTDFISGVFKADGTGHDKVLAALDVSIKPTGTGANIVITVKAAINDGQQPPAISFATGAVPPNLPSSVASAVIPSSSNDALVADFLARLQACYQLPTAQRVSGSSITATPCKQLFSQDDPTAFKQNGISVGPSGYFSGLFQDASTNVKFSNPVIQILKADGSLLLGFKGVRSDGSVSYNSRIWLTTENNSLKAKGDGYKYTFTVRPWAEFRDFVNRPEFSYWSTGFDLNVANVQSQGAPVFDRVVITTPDDEQRILRPNSGLSYLTLVQQGTLTSTSVVRLAGQFYNSGTVGVQRRLSDAGGEGLVWSTNPSDNSLRDWSEDQIKKINNIGRWKADFYLTTDKNTIAATQYFYTMSRPQTLSELRQRSWAGLTDAARSQLISQMENFAVIPSGAILPGGSSIKLSVNPNAGDFWTVPAKANPVSLAKAQGWISGVSGRWDDYLNVSSLARIATISCNPQGNSDVHCSSAGAYSSSARWDFVQLFGYDSFDVEWVSAFPFFRLPAIP
jgi:hypothetical protein